jgi:hypothetical protein
MVTYDEGENDHGGPPGCYYNAINKQLYFNNVSTSETACHQDVNCICATVTDTCKPCPEDYYSNKLTKGKCKYCATKLVDSERKTCYDDYKAFIIANKGVARLTDKQKIKLDIYLKQKKTRGANQ